MVTAEQRKGYLTQSIGYCDIKQWLLHKKEKVTVTQCNGYCDKVMVTVAESSGYCDKEMVTVT
jgi:hypothetical protein